MSEGVSNLSTTGQHADQKDYRTTFSCCTLQKKSDYSQEKLKTSK